MAPDRLIGWATANGCPVRRKPTPIGSISARRTCSLGSCGGGRCRWPGRCGPRRCGRGGRRRRSTGRKFPFTIFRAVNRRFVALAARGAHIVRNRPDGRRAFPVATQSARWRCGRGRGGGSAGCRCREARIVDPARGGRSGRFALGNDWGANIAVNSRVGAIAVGDIHTNAIALRKIPTTHRRYPPKLAFSHAGTYRRRWWWQWNTVGPFLIARQRDPRGLRTGASNATWGIRAVPIPPAAVQRQRNPVAARKVNWAQAIVRTSGRGGWRSGGCRGTGSGRRCCWGCRGRLA